MPKSVTEETVVSVRHYTDRLFAFRLTRPASFRFRSGEFIMLGLMVEGKPLLRAYSIASPSWDEGLDFYSIKVSDGPLTSRLQSIAVDDGVLLGKKPVGTLVLDALKPGKTLYFLSTGTGIAPFASLVREPEVYERFDRVVLTHTCRHVADLAYGLELTQAVMDDPLVGEEAQQKLTYYPSVTREPFERQGRITHLIESGQIFEELGTAPLDPAHDRVMICGSMDMLTDCCTVVEAAGLEEGSNARPGDYVYEKAFVS
ncbi:MAG: ferredoxin--NADP reductase [Rhodospirillaceae bacterium]|nr:ferredoxin--NADP reductase [Rhodospirillaceae bacterium]